MDRVALLKTIPMFFGLAPDDLDALAQSLTERRFAADEMVFHLGDPGSAMYIVADGAVNIHLPGEGARRVALKDVARGEYFGELALFDDKPRSASALATTDAVLFELDRDTLTGYLERRPRAAVAILRTMSEHLRATNALLSARASKNAVEEVEKNLSFGDRVADRAAQLNGSWTFILFLVVLTVAWVVINVFPRVEFDGYPYEFFNLALTILVGLQGPLIVMSQNRGAKKDRATSTIDFNVNLKNEVNLESILREMSEFRLELKDGVPAHRRPRA
jgi:uncharacterized membrane protein